MKPELHNPFPDTDPLMQAGVEPGVQTIDEAAGQPSIGTELEPSGARSGYIGTSLGKRRLLIFFSVFFLMLSALGARAGFLEIVHGVEYRSLAEGNRIRVVPIPSERGIIFDREGRLLARNIPDFTLTITPADLPRDEDERKHMIVRLAEMTELTPVDIEKALNRHPRYLTTPVPVKEHLDYDKALLLDIQSGTLPGVSLGIGTKREYLLERESADADPVLSMSHILGYLGRINEAEYERLGGEGYLPTDTIGKTGIESTYEPLLRGRYGKKKIEVDAFGREQKILAQEDAIEGDDVTLSIDMRLQEEAERFVRTSAGLNGPGRGVAVAMHPKTGEVLSLVSWPAYDANAFSSGISSEDYRKLIENPNRPLYPRAVSGTYPPGSTIKLIVAASALTEKIITPNTSFISSGGIRVSRWFFPDWKFGGHGVSNVVKAIAESVNTFFYAIGGGWESFDGLGVEKMGAYFRSFGLGERLGIDLPGEGRGFVPSIEWKEDAKDEPWYIGDTYHLAIGQGDILVTPLQVAAWTAVFANGGDLVRPKLLKTDEPEVIRPQIVTPDVIEVVRRGMRETVIGERGSARGLQTSPWSIAGKTGTAQWKTGEQNHAWFTGFAPFHDPEIVVTVLIEAGGEGSAAAAPVARNIIETWLSLIQQN